MNTRATKIIALAAVLTFAASAASAAARAARTSATINPRVVERIRKALDWPSDSSGNARPEIQADT